MLLGLMFVGLALSVVPDHIKNEESTYKLSSSNIFRDKIVYKSIEERSTLILHQAAKSPRSMLELVERVKANRKHANAKKPNLRTRKA